MSDSWGRGQTTDAARGTFGLGLDSSAVAADGRVVDASDAPRAIEPPSRAWDRMLSLALVVVAWLGPELLANRGGRARYAAFLALACFGVGVIRGRPQISALGAWRSMLVLLGASLAVAALALSPFSSGDALRLALAVPTTLAGWTAVLALLVLWPVRSRTPSASDVRSAATVGLRLPPPSVSVALAFVVVAVAHALVMPRWAILIDEAFYRLQSYWLSMPGLVWHIPPDLQSWFTVRHAAIVNDGMLTQYPPGWPALLAIFRALRLEWWSGAIMAAVTVWLGYRLATRLLDEQASRLAALLLAISPWLARVLSGYMAHALTIPCGVGAALLLFDVEQREARDGALRAIGAGFLLGLAFSARPLTGVLLGMTLLAWRVARGRWTTRTSVALAWTVVGGALPAVLTFWFNAKTTGHPFVFGYKAVEGPFHDLGFGLRGFIEYDATGRPVPMLWPYTPAQALGNFAKFVRALSNEFLPVGLLLPLLWLARALRFELRWGYLAGFVLFPLVHCLYWYGELRMVSELLPFVAIVAAAFIAAVAASSQRLARGLVVAAAAGAVLYDASAFETTSEIETAWRPPSYIEDRRILSLFDTAEALRRERGRLLVFAAEARPNVFVPGYSRLFMLNARGFDSDVLVARDRGAADSALATRFPDRTPVRIVWDDRFGRARVELLPRVPVRAP